MLVKDLIDHLSSHDENLPVMLDCYEGGLDDLDEVQEVDVILNHNEEEYLGKHELASNWNAIGPAIKAVHLMPR